MRSYLLTYETMICDNVNSDLLTSDRLKCEILKYDLLTTGKGKSFEMFSNTSGPTGVAAQGLVP